jgi:hypothetical protein
MRTTFYGTPVMARDEAGRYRRLAEHEVPVSIEDGGQARIMEFDSPGEEGIFVRIQSWSESKEHGAMDLLMGRRVRVTIEVID